MTNDPKNQDDENQNEETDAPVSELAHLKAKADKMGLSYSPNIGVDKLRERINAKLNDEPDPGEEAPKAKKGTKEKEEEPVQTEAQRVAALRKKMHDDNMFLVRLRIANLNPSKKDLQGEIFTVVNKYLGAVSKFIPYGEASDNGYHVENILYQQMKERKFNSVTTRMVDGQIVVKQKWVPEFALEVMEPLTLAEIKDLAASQAASRSTAD